MGRPSKLTDKQWGEIGRRLANGESNRALAKEYKIAVSTISERFSERVPEIKELAQAIATTERAFERLPVSEQCSVRKLADQLKDIQDDYAETAANGAKTAAHLSRLARAKASRLTEDALAEDLRGVAALSETANKALQPASNLIAANKGQDQKQPKSLEDILEEANRIHEGRTA